MGKQAFHALFIRRNAWVHLTIGPFEVGVRDESGTTVSGAGDVDHVEVVLFDQPVQVNVDEVQTRCRSPVAEQARFDVLLCERLLQQRVVIEVDLTDGEVVGGPPIRIHHCAFFVRQCGCHRFLLDPCHRSAQARRRISRRSSPGDAADHQHSAMPPPSHPCTPKLAAPLERARREGFLACCEILLSPVPSL